MSRWEDYQYRKKKNDFHENQLCSKNVEFERCKLHFSSLFLQLFPKFNDILRRKHFVKTEILRDGVFFFFFARAWRVYSLMTVLQNDFTCTWLLSCSSSFLVDIMRNIYIPALHSSFILHFSRSCKLRESISVNFNSYFVSAYQVESTKHENR